MKQSRCPNLPDVRSTPDFTLCFDKYTVSLSTLCMLGNFAYLFVVC